MTSPERSSQPPPVSRPRRRRWLYALLALLALLALAIGVAGLATGAVYARLAEPYKGYAAGELFVDIPSGTPVTGISQRLVDAGVVRDTLTFRVALWQSNQSRALKAGEYRFDRPLRAGEVIDRLARGDVYLRSMTFPEGQTIREMAALFERHGGGSADAFIDAGRQATLVADIDPGATDLEGYLFPDTYRFPRGATAADVVGAMVQGFTRVFDTSMRADAGARNLAVRRLMTLASLVEEETARPDERPTVAAVYLNRLQIGMPLQCDPTVIYALQRAGRYTGNLTRADLEFNSPYNTYRFSGLPPGPIASPGKAAIEAVLRPAAVKYLYFVSRNDGSHAFASTLDEHNRNVHEYQVKYFRDRK